MAATCAGLEAIALDGVQISSATLQEAGTLPPDEMSEMTGGATTELSVGAHCLVEGVIDEREGVNGTYGIRFQLRMPTEWNGRFLYQGGGGTDGFIAPAIGAIPTNGSTAVPALVRGYAVVSTNSGHQGRDVSFAADQQARLDLGYVAIGKVTQTAKSLVRAYYEQAPDKSFFMGCSNGGRQAMMAAQRFPLEFDGVVAGNPAFHLSQAAVAGVWDVTQLRSIAPNGALPDALTQADLDIVAAEVNAQCDALDGIEDGIVAAFRQCKFDPEALHGQIDEQKLQALTAIMQGPVDDQGNSLYSTWPWDPGIAAAGWRMWKLGTADQPGLHETLMWPTTGAMLMTPPQEVPENPDFGDLSRAVSEVGGYMDADDTFLTTFAQRGGKMIVFQGMADPIFSADDIARWHDAAVADTGEDFAQLFMVPGLTHCGGGNATFEDFDPLTALEDWTAGGEVPTSIPARAPALPEREMPICAWPMEAIYTGGDVNRIDSFTCSE